MNVFELFAKLSLDTSEYDEGINSAKKEGKDLKSALGDAGKTFAGIGAAAAGAGTAVFAFANKVSKNADQIDKMSQKLGMSAEAYQEWDYVLQLNGTSISNMSGGMKTLINTLDDAKQGTEAAIEKFERIGLSIEDIQDLSQEELFAKVIEQFQGMEDTAERAAMANDLLGRSATELRPLFNSTTEATQQQIEALHNMGGVMSDEAVKDGAAFQDSLTSLKEAFSGAANTLGAELMPYITEMMDGITNFIAEGGLDGLIAGFKMLAPVIAGATTAMVAYKAASAIAGVIEALTKATEAQTIAQTILNAVMNANPIVLLITVIMSLIAAFATLWATSEDFRNFWIDLWNGIKEASGKVVDWLGSMFTEKIPNMIANVINFFKELPGKALQWGKDLLDSFIQGIKDKIAKLGDTLKGAADKVKSFLGFSEPEEGPLSNFHTFAPDMMDLFAQGIRDNENVITDAISDSFNVGRVIDADAQQAQNQMQGTVQLAGTGGFGGDLIIPVYIGGERFTEAVISANELNDYLTGGRG